MTTAENVLPLAAPSSAAEETRPVVLPGTDVPTEIRGDEIWLTLGERRYRVLGLNKNTSMGVLRVNVMVTAQNTRGEISLHVDMLDLYGARQRTAYARQAGAELGIKEEIIERDLRRVLLKLETLQREQLKKTLEPEETKIEMTAEEKAAALDLLRDPRLVERIVEDFARCGVVGEETNKHRWLSGRGVAALRAAGGACAIESAAGKSSLMDAVLAFVPEEQQVQYSAMTGQALFYMGETGVEAQGAGHRGRGRRAARRLCVEAVASGRQAEHRLDRQRPEHGRLITHEYGSKAR